jgi:hypothetical protein
MLKGILTSLIITGISVSAKCDTIDFWHVYYNKVKKIECSIPDYCTFSFPKDSIKPTDSIEIHYFMDSRCYDCVETLSVKDKDGKEIYAITMEEEARSQGLMIPVAVLLESRFHDFDLYFRRSEKYKESRILKISIF